MHRIVICSLALASAGAAAQPSADSALFEPASVNVGGPSGDIAIADVNRDGHLDLIVVHPPGPIASVRLGDGKGAFN